MTRNGKGRRIGKITALVALVLSGLPVSAPVLAMEPAPGGAMLCQGFADAYATRVTADTTLPQLFETPFDFATLDWMPLDVGKAVDVIKQANINAFPGVSGSLYCMADGTIKQFNTCVDPKAAADDPALIDRFSRMAETAMDITGALAGETQRFTARIDTLKKAAASGGKPALISEYFMLGTARSGFLTADANGVCFVITQAISPEMQGRLDAEHK